MEENKSASSSTSSEYKKKQELFAQVQEALQIYNPDKLPTVTQRVYSKEDLRTYMENPSRNVKNLRNLSRFLRNRSQVYRKIINDNATMIDTHCRTVIPNIDLNKKATSGQDKKMIKSFYETCDFVEKMNLPSEMLKAYLECWTCDVFFGAYYYYKDEGGIMIPLDPDYCQIVGVYPTGDFVFAFDLSYFRNRQEELELLGEPFTGMHRKYQSNTTENRWQIMPDEYACCFKVNIEDYLTPIPPYVSLFDSIVNLEDLKEIMAIADEEQIYKLITFRMKTLTNSKTVDDFEVDPATATEYYNKVVETLPDYVSAILTPLEVDTINFDKDQATDVNKVTNASKNILKTSGHSALADPSGTTATIAALKCDEDYAISSLLPQTEGWVNRMLKCHLSNPCKVKFLEVTKFTKDAFKESLIKDLNYGLPLIMTLGALNGYSETDLISMARMNDSLGIRDLFKPFQTAATQSGKDNGGRPENDIPTDESESSQDKRDSSGRK